MKAARPLSGWRVLVPRGGIWGDSVSAGLRARGAAPVVAPLVNFAGAEDPGALADALRRLEEGRFDWIVIASATAVDVLLSQSTVVPERTRIAAVGETTAVALQLAGYRADFVPQSDISARGLVAEWPTGEHGGRAVLLESDIAEPTLRAGLQKLGFSVETVTAYRTVAVPVAPDVAADVASGRIGAVLVTSGSVARQVAAQLAPLPDTTVVVFVGPRTAADARAVGLPVHMIAGERSTESLIAALVDYIGSD